MINSRLDGNLPKNLSFKKVISSFNIHQHQKKNPEKQKVFFRTFKYQLIFFSLFFF